MPESPSRGPSPSASAARRARRARDRPPPRALPALLGWLALCLLSPARAENYFQLRWFGPSSGLNGFELDGRYSVQAAGFNLQLQVPQLSLQTQNATFSAAGGAFFAYANVSADALLGRSTLSALLGYSAPQPGPLSDASFTVTRALDANPASGYALTGLALNARGRLAPGWNWTLDAAQNASLANATPDAPSLNRSLSLGVQGKAGSVDLRARARLSLDSQTPDVLRWNANLQAGLPLSDTERLEAELEYDRVSRDRERLSLSSTRLDPLTLNASLSRADGLLSASVGADAPIGDSLSLGAQYGLTFSSPLAQNLSLSLNARPAPWTVSAGLTAELNPDASGTPQPALGLTLAAAYSASQLGFQLRGNARYAAGQAQPWTYHLDASLASSARPLGWSIGLRADSASSTRPLQASLDGQLLYAVGDHWQLNGSARYRLGSDQPALQFGAGVRYVF